MRKFQKITQLLQTFVFRVVQERGSYDLPNAIYGFFIPESRIRTNTLVVFVPLKVYLGVKFFLKYQVAVVFKMA